MTIKKAAVIILLVLCYISIAINGYLIFSIVKLTQAYQTRQVNDKVLAFRNMFTEKVLLSDQDVDFNTRMTLETSVRSLNDPEIFDQWEKFTQSATKEEATAEAKKLLNLLIQKTSK